jgi:cell division initiation protein
MGLSPLDIQQKTFRASLRGYAEDEVDEFLDEVVIAMRENEQKVADAEAAMREMQNRLSEGSETEDTLRRTLLAAQRAADQITEEARRESEKMLSDARAEASRQSVESGREKNRLLDELERLRGIVADVRGRLADLAGDMTGRIGDAADEIDAAAGGFTRWDDPADGRVGRREIDEPTPTLDELANGSKDADTPDYVDLEADDDDYQSADDLVDTEDDEEDDDWDDSDDDWGDDDRDQLVVAAEDQAELAESRSARRPWERYDD